MNTIGNNYAISTSDLASSLTRSSAALVAAGNTMEEAVALTAAANTIIQDADSVGNALKTVSMRLRGTTTKELEAAGEETDGAVENVSKLYSKVKALTAVNGKAGISILGDDGKYLSTYEILTKIAERWEEITETGNDAALLELIAGKTRGSVVAALLQQPEILKDAYEDAFNADGSALAENEKYLDSIQGKIDKFNNAVQTMWSNTLDDEVVKLFVDLGTIFVNWITDLGLIKTLLFGALTYLSVFAQSKIDFASILGLQDFQGKSIIGKEGFTGWIAKKFINKNAEKQQITQDINEVLNSAESTLEKGMKELADGQMIMDFDGLLPSSDSKYFDIFKNGIGSKEELNIDNLDLLSQELDKLNNLDNQSIVNYMQSLGDLGEESGNTAKVLAAYASTVTDGNYRVQDAIKYVEQHNQKIKSSGASAKAAAIGHAVLNAAISMGISLLISIGLSAITSWINKNKELAKAAEEATNAYKNATKTLKDHYDTIKDIKDDYAKLAKGVDSLGRNVSLSTEEYEQYNKIANKIADMFPEMVAGFTDEGTAIISLKGNVEELTKAYEAEAQAARQALLASKKETFNTFKSSVDNDASITWDNVGLRQQKILAEEIIKIYNTGDAQKIYEFFDDLNSGMEIAGETFRNIELNALFDAAGVVRKNFTDSWDGSIDIDKMKNEMTNLFLYYNTLSNKIRTETAPVKSLVGAWLLENFDYQKLSNTSQDLIKNFINNLDVEFYRQFNNENEMFGYIQNHILYPLQNANMDTEIDLAFDLQTQFNNSQIPVGQYVDEINEFIGLLSELGFDEEIVKTIKAVFDIDNLETKQNSAKELLDNPDMVVKFTQDELDAIDDYKDKLKIDENTVYSYEELKQKLKELQQVTDDSSVADSLLTIATLEDAYNTLGEAMKEFKEDGTVAAKTLEGLHDAFKDVDGFEELYKVLATGEGDAAAAITKVANAYINQKGILEDLSDEERNIMMARLKTLGVINAEEALRVKQACQNAQAELDAKYQQYSVDLSNYATAEEAKLAIAAQISSTLSWIEDSTVDALGEKYGVDLSNFGTTQEKKVELAIKAGKAIAEANKAAALSELDKQYVGTERYRESYKIKKAEIEESYNNAISSIPTENIFNEIQSIVNSYKYAPLKFDFSGDQIGIGRDYDDLIDDDDKTDKALETLQKKYERQIKNLDNQITYLENEISLLEAKDEAVSKSYYEEQNALIEQKIKLLQQEREELLKLERTDEVAEALWEVEHQLQEESIQIAENIQKIVELYKEAFDEIGKAYDDKDDFLSDQSNYIDKYRDLLELQGSPEAASGFQEQIAIEEEKMADNITELAALEQTFADAMASGYLKEGSDEWIEMQDEIRATEEAILDNKIAIEELNEEMKQMAVDAFNTVRDAFNNKNDYYTNQQDYIEGYADYLEAIGVDAPAELYNELIAIEQEKRTNNLANLVDARAGLEYLESQGFTAADEEWQDAYQQIVELEKQIQDSDIAMAQWEQTIREMDFEKFDRFISRLDDINSEIEHIQNLLADEDVAFEDGTWTEEGITSLGLLYQQMQLAEQISQEYADEIEKLNEAYQQGSMSEQEYYERLQELKEGQWSAIESYEDAKDAIVDMEEARIDMIEEGIQKEIDAMEELIQLKKDELSSECELWEFKNRIKDKTTNIGNLQRQIASMSGSTDAATVAQRVKLEAELRKAQEELDNEYISHSYDAQSQALDDEQEAYTDAQEKYIEALRDTLEGTTAIISQKISEWLLNADVGLETLNGISQEHGITLSDALMQPWQNASLMAESFKQIADENVFSLINEDGVVTYFDTYATEAFNSVFAAGGSAATLFKNTVNEQVNQIKSVVQQSTSPLTANLKFPWDNTSSADGPISTFSTKAKNAINDALTKAKSDAEATKYWLKTPWDNAATAVNTFSTTVGTVLGNVAIQAEATAAAINKVAEAAKNVPSYTGGGNGGNGGNDPTPPANNPTPVANDKYTRYAYLQANGSTYIGKGKGATVELAEAAARADLLPDLINEQAAHYSTDRLQSMWDNIWSIKIKYTELYPTKIGNSRGELSQYATGTLGTNKNELAVVDELGEELILHANEKTGRLEYLTKGSSVIPHDATTELMKLADIGVDGLTMPKFNSGINFTTNAINKPEIKLDIENLLRCDNVSQDSLPELKKFVTEELDKFSKNLNYSLKRIGAK